MSLVAYGASDDSDKSDVEDTEVSQTHDADKGNRFDADDGGQISDEDDYMPTSTLQTHENENASSLKPTRAAVTTSSLMFLSSPVTLHDLPAPKTQDSNNTSTTVGDTEDELEDEVKPKASQLADAPKPPPKKVKQPARITIPALNPNPDEELEDKQKIKPAAAKSSSGSGLFALLPPPLHGSKKQVSRPLIPYTLTKRPMAPNSSAPASSPSKTDDFVPSQKHQSAFNALTGYESDSDDEKESGHEGSTNFFSLGVEEVAKSSEGDLSNSAQPISGKGDADERTAEGTESVLDTEGSTALSSSKVTSTAGATAGQSSDITNVSEESRIVDETSEEKQDEDSSDDEVTCTVGIPQVDQNAPLSFSSAMQGRHWSAAPLVSPMMPEMFGATSTWKTQQHYAQEYSTDDQQETETEPGSSSDMQNYLEDEQFLRISGKRKRGHEEDIRIIDAKVDDYVDSGDLMKGITEESSYQPHRKKDNMPSAQQKRKKQITYLAFQAKERELELKNAWSQNKMTKNQARSKYGF